MTTRKHDGRIKRIARQALARYGGKCTTSCVAELAYPDRIPGRWTKGELRNVRRALAEFAVPIGRSRIPPGRPLVWKRRAT